MTIATADKNPTMGASGVPDARIDALPGNSGPHYALIALDMIAVHTQIRENFEDAEHSLADLAASIAARGVLQPILLRPAAGGYELVAGERRYRAAKLAGLVAIPAYIRAMTDDEADDAQLAENIHRKNLTQIEEARKIQRDLDRLGSVDAVLEKHQKSRAWLSKMLALLSLPEQARRLVTENVSADVEVINTVRTVEKADPEKARALVDALKRTRGRENARDLAAAAREEVKPGKKQAAQGKRTTNAVPVIAHGQPVPTDGVQVSLEDVPFSPAHVLNLAYADIFLAGGNPAAILGDMQEDDKEVVDAWLRAYHDAGKHAEDAGRAVIQGFRKGQFAMDGDGAFALVAFLQGAQSSANFDLLSIFGNIKR